MLSTATLWDLLHHEPAIWRKKKWKSELKIIYQHCWWFWFDLNICSKYQLNCNNNKNTNWEHEEVADADINRRNVKSIHRLIELNSQCIWQFMEFEQTVINIKFIIHISVATQFSLYWNSAKWTAYIPPIQCPAAWVLCEYEKRLVTSQMPTKRLINCAHHADSLIASSMSHEHLIVYRVLCVCVCGTTNTRIICHSE